MNRHRQLVAEALGSALLLAAVVGSGIMGERLAGGNVALALLANSVATGCVLYVLILVLAPVSGAHFNPVVSLAAALSRKMTWGHAAAYVVAQFTGALAGVAAAHLMFGEDLFTSSQHARSGPSQWWAEAVATFGLLVVVLGSAQHSVPAIAAAVGAYITAAYWFTASTSFANPAVTLARAGTDTFTGIRPDDVGAFMLAQVAGALAACFAMRWLLPPHAPPNAQ